MTMSGTDGHYMPLDAEQWCGRQQGLLRAAFTEHTKLAGYDLGWLERIVSRLPYSGRPGPSHSDSYGGGDWPARGWPTACLFTSRLPLPKRGHAQVEE